LKLRVQRASAASSGAPELAWVDDFWARAGEHIFCRTDDGVLILPPNRVYKLNPTGASLIDYLKRGGSMRTLRLPSEEAARDTGLFFGDLAALYRGDQPVNGTVGAEQYSFTFTRLPVLGEIALTYRCNNACRFCYAGCGADVDAEAAAPLGIEVDAGPERRARAGIARAGTECGETVHIGTVSLHATASPQMTRPERSTADYRRVIDIFADEAKIPFFSFTGGEPTLRNDLEELISHARGRGLIINLVTNGTLIDDARAASLKAAGLGSAQVSIEAPNAETHDFLAGRTGAFAETLAGIAALRRAGIPTQTNTTITRANIDLVRAMPSFLRSLGISRFAMNLFIPTIPGPWADRLFVPYEEIGPYVDTVAKAARALDMTFFWYSPTPFCTYNPIARGHGNKSCAAADGLISVAPDGAILPCSSWDEPIGNLFDQPFRALWFSERARFFKEKHFAPEPCRACESFTACQGACPLYWRYTRTQPQGLAARKEYV